jgi:hypothetical protein
VASSSAHATAASMATMTSCAIAADRRESIDQISAGDMSIRTTRDRISKCSSRECSNCRRDANSSKQRQRHSTAAACTTSKSRQHVGVAVWLLYGAPFQRPKTRCSHVMTSSSIIALEQSAFCARVIRLLSPASWTSVEVAAAAAAAAAAEEEEAVVAVMVFRAERHRARPSE